MGPMFPDTFVYRRPVRYGDCDASRNYYTPRAIDYAVEAVEKWFEDVLGVSWTELAARCNWQVNFVHVGCEFLKTLTDGEVVQARVGVAGVENSQIMFRVSAENDAGSPCFLASLTASLVERTTFASVSIPLHYRERIDNYQASCEEVKAPAEDAGRQADVEPSLSSLMPAKCGDVPFILTRRVTYGECGASGTIYSPRVFDYLLDAAGEWYGKFLGISWMEQNIRKNGQPFLNITCDYLKPMVPGQLISTIVTVSKLGSSSIVYSIAGCDEMGAMYFNARITACYVVDDNGSLKPTPFPDELRARITAYQAACAAIHRTLHQ